MLTKVKSTLGRKSKNRSTQSYFFWIKFTKISVGEENENINRIYNPLEKIKTTDLLYEKQNLHGVPSSRDASCLACENIPPRL